MGKIMQKSAFIRETTLVMCDLTLRELHEAELYILQCIQYKPTPLHIYICNNIMLYYINTIDMYY